MSELNYEAIAHLTETQIEDLCRMYQSEWWSKGRHKTDVQKMLQHSDIIIAFCHPETKKLLAFARILTDYVYRGLILDVIVEHSYRGKGLGKRLMEAIINHPELQSVEKLLLFCLPEVIPFYQKWGFLEGVDNVRLMVCG
ncbi:GNAT family N-acetyltransferase [Pleurocapsales cyanobacterium LEGE 06147]|nr:GNAT family N-acetyltransferase [Pleurocapsales cyanobacterium LEGE 06147]